MVVFTVRNSSSTRGTVQKIEAGRGESEGSKARETKRREQTGSQEPVTEGERRPERTGREGETVVMEGEGVIVE